MALKPITFWSHKGGPNPWKVWQILEELQLPYEQKILEVPDMKKKPYESINPNGRAPAIEDPNTATTLWESCAIIEYLAETYDKGHNISFAAGTKEAFEAKQWLFYQASGQGPYFGQTVWFTIYHPEKVPSAVDRYIDEIHRVSTVLDNVLKDREWLVGGKFSYVDASFMPWYAIVFQIFADRFNPENDYPNLVTWLDRIKARPAIAKVLKEREAIMNVK